MWDRKHVISINDFSRQDIEDVLNVAAKMDSYLENGNVPELMKGKIMATLFFEPSTRTRLSFEAAMERLGGRVIGFADPSATSIKKKETTADTIRMAAAYADIIAMRHPNPGAARLAAEVSSVPVLNGGDGSHQHPTQTLLDLYTIKKELGRLDGIKIAMVGDLKYGRTVHSLCSALKHFDAKFRFISPEQLKMPDQYKRDASYEETSTLDISDVDVVYVTRIQAERFADPAEYEKLKGFYVINKEKVSTMKKNSIIMHPLPRVDEIHPEVDVDPRAKYFKQAYYGVPTRMAIIAMVMGAI